MIRVLQVLPTLKRAGAERVAVSLACHLDRRRFECRVLSLYDAFPGGFEPVLEAAAIPVHHLGKHKGLHPAMVPALRRVFSQWQPHIIQTHSYVLRYVLPAHWGLAHSRIVHTVHNEAAREVDSIGRMIHRFAYRRGVVPVAVGSRVAETFEAMYGFAPAAVIPNGIDLQPFDNADAGVLWRQRNGFPAHQKLAVSLARLEDQKNPLGLVEAFRLGLANEPNWHLVLAGEGSLRRNIEEAIGHHNLSHRIHLVGLQPDVPALLSAANLFVLASHYEGRPMAVMEAMAAGLPVVATEAGGIREVVLDQTNGLLVATNDTQALAAAMRRLATDESLRLAFGQASRENATAFGLQPMLNGYTKLYEALSNVAPGQLQEGIAS
jgi:glycosyltransferase involved in cell wall biosynthesis